LDPRRVLQDIDFSGSGPADPQGNAIGGRVRGRRPTECEKRTRRGRDRETERNVCGRIHAHALHACGEVRRSGGGRCGEGRENRAPVAAGLTAGKRDGRRGRAQEWIAEFLE